MVVTANKNWSLFSRKSWVCAFIISINRYHVVVELSMHLEYVLCIPVVFWSIKCFFFSICEQPKKPFSCQTALFAGNEANTPTQWVFSPLHLSIILQTFSTGVLNFFLYFTIKIEAIWEKYFVTDGVVHYVFTYNIFGDKWEKLQWDCYRFNLPKRWDGLSRIGKPLKRLRGPSIVRLRRSLVRSRWCFMLWMQKFVYLGPFCSGRWYPSYVHMLSCDFVGIKKGRASFSSFGSTMGKKEQWS